MLNHQRLQGTLAKTDCDTNSWSWGPFTPSMVREPPGPGRLLYVEAQHPGGPGLTQGPH